VRAIQRSISIIDEFKRDLFKIFFSYLTAMDRLVKRALFLASDDISYITDIELFIDGDASQI
jgi:hypothetical protein